MNKETYIVADNEIDTQSAGTFEGKKVTSVNIEITVEVYEANLQDFLQELSDLIEKY